MNNDFFTKIRSNYTRFTHLERRIADYILQNPGNVLYMSIVDLAEACDVGDTSVFRFCKKLKLKGYQDFKMQLALSTSTNEEDAPQMMGEISLNDSVDVIIKKILATTVDALQETSQFISPGAISETVEYMIHANKVLFLGCGASMVTAIEAKNKFMRITRKVDFALDSHMQAMQASLLTSEDVAIAISYSGSTKDTIKLAQICKNAGAKVVCITRFSKSPLVNCSDVVLLCGANEGPFQGGSLSAKISQLYLLDVLFMEYFKRTVDISQKSMEKTARSVLDTHY